jgi:L-ascorbate metabolism protein UlaG (beta-lactamase superfamily)
VRPEEIAWDERALGGGAVSVRWLGTAGFAIEHEGHTLLIDPYVTRASLARCAALRVASDARAIDAYVPRADAIIVGHTHFDHALDVPQIARKTGAKVFGSRSAATLCRAENVRDAQIDVVESTTTIEREVGPFRLRFVPSAHSRFAAGRIPFPGEIADCDDVPMRIGHYRCGAVFGVEIKVEGRTLFHLGSAELVDATLDAREVDLLLLCVAGWTASKDLPERVARKLSPKGVLLSHWDDFFRPLDRPARALPAMKLPALVDRLTTATRDAKVGTVPIFGRVLL